MSSEKEMMSNASTKNYEVTFYPNNQKVYISSPKSTESDANKSRQSVESRGEGGLNYSSHQTSQFKTDSNNDYDPYKAYNKHNKPSIYKSGSGQARKVRVLNSISSHVE
jgi:hypothetical protein